MKHATKVAIFSSGVLVAGNLLETMASTGFDLHALSQAVGPAEILSVSVLGALGGFFFVGKLGPSLFQMMLFSLPLDKRTQALRGASSFFLVLLGLDKFGNKLP